MNDRSDDLAVATLAGGCFWCTEAVFFPHTPEQRATAEEVIAELEGEGVWGDPIVTSLEQAGEFYPAEAYHHEYYRRNPRQGYCQVVIAPKLAKFRKQFADRLRERPAEA